MQVYKNGVQAGWDKYAKGHISVQLSEKVEVNPNLKYDFPKGQYDSIAAKMQGIQQARLSSTPYPHTERGLFSDALKRIHLDILDYIAAKLSLTSTESNLLQAEYLKAHDDMVGIYYNNFRNIINHENIEMKHKNFYNFNTYYYSDAFIRVVRDGICGVSDVMFTFVKKNSLYASVTGLDNIGEGHICQLVMEKVVFPIKVHLDRITLGYDYNVAIPRIIASLNENLSKIVLETREVPYPELVRQTVTLSDGTIAHLTLQLYAYVGLSVDQELIDHTLSDEGSFIKVKISDKPFVLHQVFHVAYKVINTDVTSMFQYETPKYSFFGKVFFWKKPPKIQKVMQKKKIDMSKEYENLFNQHKTKVTYEIISEIVKKQNLSSNCMNTFLPMVEKFFEPLLSIPTSHYAIKLDFGNQHKEIFRTF
jgi:hypothetical protein